MKLENLFKKGKKFVATVTSLALLGLGSAYIVSCGDDGNGNGHVNKAPTISQIIYNSPSFENCGRFTTDHDIEVTAEVTYSDDGVNKVYVDEKRGAETEYTSHEMSKIDTDTYSIVLTGFGEQTNLTSRVRAEDYAGTSATSDIENIIIYVNNAPSTPTWSGNNVGFETDIYDIYLDSTDSEDDSITYEIENKPSDPDATFNQTTGVFHWETDCADAGTYPLKFYSIDKCGKKSEPSEITVTILDAC